MKIKSFIGGLIINLLLLNPVFAQNNINTNLKSTANLSSFCKFSINDLVFGVVDFSKKHEIWHSGYTYLNIKCTKSTPYNAKISAGSQPYMNAYRFIYHNGNTSNDSLRYYLHQLDGRYWGDGTRGVPLLSKIATGNMESHIVWGNLEYKYVTPGNYFDTLTMTITY